MMRVRSIRFQWIMLSFFISIVPLVCLQLVYFAIATERVKSVTEEEARQKAEQVRSIVLREIEDEKRGLLLLGDFLKTFSPTYSLDSLRHHIANYFFTYRHVYSRASLLDDEGHQKFSFIRYSSPEYLYEPKWEEGFAYPGLPEETVKGLRGKVTSLGYYPSRFGYSERLVLSIDKMGFIMADLRLKAVYVDAAQQARISPGDEVFVFNRDKTIVYATESSWNDKNVEDILVKLSGEETDPEKEPFVLGYSGNEELLSVGIVAHYGSLLVPLNQTLEMGLWITLLFAAAIIFIVWLFTYRLKRAFKPLIGATDEIASGNLDHRVPRSSFLELDILSKHFNKMAERLKSLLNEMAQKEQMALLGEFSSFVIHDLKSPLSAMELLAENLDEEIQESPLSKSLSKYTRNLSLGIKKLEKFVENILDYVRPMELSSVEVNLEEFIQEISAECPFEVRFDPHDSMLLVLIDPDQFKRVVLNLLENAREAIENKEDGEITVKTFSKNNRAFINFRDNGSGISEEDKLKIFDLYYTTKTGRGGHGFGLTIVKRIVEAHGGEIDFQSKAGKGTMFTVELPIGG